MSRIRRRTLLSRFASVLVCMFAIGQAAGQSPDPGADAELSPLARKEEMIRSRFERFQDRVFRLREQLAPSEPDNAARLARVLSQAGETGLSARLDELIHLLDDSSSMSTALDEQAKWVADVERLLSILLERDGDNQERDRRMDRLDEFRREVSRILDQQRALQNQSAQSGSAGSKLEQLDAVMHKLDALQKGQARVSEKTARQADSEDSSKNNELRQQQEKLAKDAQDLAQDLGSLDRPEPDGSEHTEQPDAERSDVQSGEQAVQEASEAMSQAAESLSAGESSAASARQKNAEESLRRARDHLQKARQALQNQPEDASPSQQQKRLGNQTGSLAQRMRAGGGGQGPQSPGQQQSDGQDGPAPGTENVEQAQQAMESAAESLDGQALDEAAEDQQAAVDDLERALRELEDELFQLRKEDREETLRDLEARFRRMLSEQRSINASTSDLAELGRDSFQRAEQLQLAGLATRERTLSDQAATCAHILEEEGTTVVFPQIVGQLSKDMRTVEERLADLQVGPITQTVEREIVDTLEQMLDAIKRMQQESEQQAAASSSNPEDQPLLPGSAELKLLRSSQLRVNTRTKTIEDARIAETESNESLARALANAAERQAECVEMATNMRDSGQMP